MVSTATSPMATTHEFRRMLKGPRARAVASAAIDLFIGFCFRSLYSPLLPLDASVFFEGITALKN